MSISVACSECSREYRLKDEMAGKTFACKDCGNKVRVGSAAESDRPRTPARKKQEPDENESWTEPLPPRRRAGALNERAVAAKRGSSATASRAPLFIGLAVGAVALIACAVLFLRKGDEVNSVAGSGSSTSQGSSSSGVNSTPGGFPLEPDAVNITWEGVPQINLESGSDLDYPLTPTPAVAVRNLVEGSYTSTSWNLATGKSIGQIQGLPINTGERSLSPDGQILAVLDGTRKSVDIWSYAAGKKTITIPVEQGAAAVTSMVCLSSSRVLTYTITSDGKTFVNLLKLFDATSGQLLTSKDVENPLNMNALTVSYGGKYFAASEMQKGTTIYRTETLEPAARLPAPELQFATPSGASFNPPGDRLSIVWTDAKTTLISTVNLADGTKSEVSIAGRLMVSAMTGDAYVGPAIEWLPNGSGWLLFGRTIVDAGSGLRVWTLDTTGLNGTRRRQVVHDGLLVHSGGMNLETQQLTKPGLSIVNWPVSAIAQSLSALAAKGDARLKPGSTAEVKVEIGELKYGTPKETRTKLEKAFQERLSADGMVIDANPKAVLKVSYSEADGQQMFSQQGLIPGLPSQTPPPSPSNGAPIQSTVALIKLSLQLTGETEPAWSADLLINPSVLVVRGNATAQSVRDAMFETAQWQITAAPIPYYIPKDPALPMLPGQTIYQAN